MNDDNGAGVSAFAPIRSAVLSPCRLYRYELWRCFAPGPTVAFVGLNPSTADETTDDATIRKCVGFAKRWGYGSLVMVNLFAWRATDPRDMLKVADPVGPLNDATLRRLYATVGILIAAWGNDGKHLGRDKAVMEMLPNLHCIKRNKDGSPAHPLYQPGNSTPFPMNKPAASEPWRVWQPPRAQPDGGAGTG
jgi:hypothetical protein